MNVIQKGIIALIKSAITSECQELPSDFDLEVAYPIVQKHHMEAMIYDGAVRCGIDRKSEVMKKLFKNYYQAMLRSEGQMQDVVRIFEAFEANRIDYMPLKGCKMKHLYPKPELRTMGDADILIRMDQYDRIIPLMEALGFTAIKESIHELVWQSEKLYLELHKCVIPKDHGDLYDNHQDGWESAKIQTGYCYAMIPEDELIFLFAHFTKHYRLGGVGCRHLADLWVYLRANPTLNQTYIEQELREVGLLEFYRNVRRVIAVWFEEESSNEKTDFITEIIFNNGSWGTASSATLSRAVRFSSDASEEGHGKLRYVLQTLFPTRSQLQYKYHFKLLDKMPFLLPVAWIIRLFDKVFVDRDSFKRQKNFLKVVKQDNIDEMKQALDYVGLRYNL